MQMLYHTTAYVANFSLLIQPEVLAGSGEKIFESHFFAYLGTRAVEERIRLKKATFFFISDAKARKRKRSVGCYLGQFQKRAFFL